MCWCFPFGLSNPPKRRSASSAEKKRRTHAAADSLHGDGVAVVQEKRRSRDAPQKRRPRESVTPRPQRREREDHRLLQQQYQQQYQQYQQQYQQYYDAYRNSAHYARPPLNVQVPNMWYRSVDPDSPTSSQETLLNPRPHRSPHQRQAHPKRTSQTTLRGRGAKRDPPRHSKKKSGRHESSSSRGWSLFAPSPPKTPSRRDAHAHAYQTLDASPRGHRSQRHNQQQSAHPSHQVPESSSHAQARYHQQPHRSRQRRSESESESSSRAPNAAARRVPDRRFAVLAATNQALEDLRREAFAQPSPPPRRERTQRYQGVAIPTSSIPFNWDCVSTSQASAGYEGAGGARARRRR